jgi:hypothetical protein
MIFYSKLAKLGKAEIVNCNQVSSSPTQFNLYYSGSGVTAKQLSLVKKQYSLSQAIGKYTYTEVIGMGQYIITRIGNLISIAKEEL